MIRRLRNGATGREAKHLLTQARNGGLENLRIIASSFVWNGFISEAYGLSSKKLELVTDSIASTYSLVEVDPNPYFDADYYRQSHLDEVTNSNLSPLMHYLHSGYFKGYLPNPLFGSSILRADFLKSEYNSEVVSSAVFNELFIGNSSLWEDIPPEYRECSSTATALTEVAILVPVFNNWVWTERCLRALGRCPDVEMSNVFVVDDFSSDRTLENVRAFFPNVQVIENLENLGFLKSCNRAFDLLKKNYGYILLLNNDTEPLPGFLNEMLETLKLFDDTAAVGARLIYPDETIQEIGGIVWRDGTGWNFGRGRKQEASLLNSRRVDYSSGACLLIDTKHIDSGVFDTVFSPAYYEDTDLAFRLRQIGYQTRVAPFAVVIHHEGKSNGTDLSQGLKRFQAVNAEKFRRKWSETLTSHFDYDPLRVREASLRLEVEDARGVLLWIDYQLPDSRRDSGSMRAVQIAKILRSIGLLLVFVPANGDTRQISPNQLLRLGVIVEKDLKSAFDTSRRLGIYPDFIMLSRAPIASEFLPTIKEAFPGARIIFDTVDLHFLRLERQAIESADSSLKTAAAAAKKLELETIKQCEVTLVVSDYEKSLLAELVPNARVEVVSNIHDTDNLDSRQKKCRGMVFVGSFLHTPNAEGLRWFFHEVWPLIDKEVRLTGLTIIGQKPPKWLMNLNDPDVKVLGWVEDADSIIASSTVSIAPLRSGAGVKGKVGHSIQLGTPVVGTSVALEGMHLIHGESVMEANTPEDFAKSVEKLCLDGKLASGIAKEAEKVLRRFFSSEVAKVSILRALESDRL